VKPADVGVEHLGQWQAAAISTLDWWRDAGVDVLVDEAPRDWLARPAPARPAPEPVAAPTALPATLAEFLAWRIGETAPESGWRGASIPAGGPLDAELMVLVDCPDKDDRDGLLGGPAGKLFDRMLAAIGLGRDAVHLAALCCRRPVAGRMPKETEAELHRLALHHLGLLGPKRLLLLSDAASRAILGTEVLRARGTLRSVNHKGGETLAVATFHPRLLLERPAQKADAWKDLQLLMGTR
jgi:uracil-DNA glycosylase family 4